MSAVKNISLYIPHVFPNFDKEYVANAFKNIGEISHIDFIAKRDHKGNNFNAVYIHFKKWFNNKNATNLYEDVLDEKREARLYHDEQWYWLVLPNTAKKIVPGERKLKIDLSDLKVTPEKKSGEVVCPGAPTKSKKNVQFTQLETKNLAEEFEEADLEALEDEAKMAEIEAFMDEEDSYLVNIDGRYVQSLEQENWQMRCEIAQLRAALINLDQMYQAEVAKVRAFSNNEEN